VVDGREEAIEHLGTLLGAEMRLDGSELSIAGRTIAVPDFGDERFRTLPSALPSRAHGDQREKLIYKAVQDAARGSESEVPWTDVEFADALEDELPFGSAEERSVLAGAMRDSYWAPVKRVNFLVPYHTALAANFAHSVRSPWTGRPVRQRYKMFTGEILEYLCWRGDGADEGLIDAFLGVFNDQDGFTLLDELLYGAALHFAGSGAAEHGSAAALARRFGDAARNLEAGAFCQPALDLFQRDLRTVLAIRTLVPRRDMLDHLTALLSLHLALLYYRIATVLGSELDAVIGTLSAATPAGSVCDCSGGLEACPLAGRIAFRIGTRSDRPVRENDPCAVAHRELDSSRLLAMPAVIEAANLADELWTSLGAAPRGGGRPRMAALAAAVGGDRELARAIDLGTAAWAALYSLDRGTEADPTSAARAAARRPGLFALKEAIVGANRTGLRHTSRDVVNQLAKRERGGSLISTRGRVSFFELDEEFLFLLATLASQGRRITFDKFLTELRAYGLAPQDRAETERLSAALERLGLLHRFSDADTAVYVEPPHAT
jgi:hypothetical protein